MTPMRTADQVIEDALYAEIFMLLESCTEDQVNFLWRIYAHAPRRLFPLKADGQSESARRRRLARGRVMSANDLGVALLAVRLPLVGARFSTDRTRRLWLGRSTGVDSPRRLFICGVQPSDADETTDDPTITREFGFAARWGFGALDKVNLFDRHSPDPSTLYADVEPVSAENDAYVFAAAARCDLHVCVWGNHGAYLARGTRMARLLRQRGHQLYVFGFTKQGYPIHTLARGKMRIPDDAKPIAWRHP